MLGRTSSCQSIARKRDQRQNSSRDLLAIEGMSAKEILTNKKEERELLALDFTQKIADFQGEKHEPKMPNRPIFRLEKRGAFALIQDPFLSRKRGLISTEQARPDEPADGFASAGMVMGILSIPLIAAPLVSFFGIVFSVIGLFRTRSGERKGRGMAVAGLICSSLSALVLYIALSSLAGWG